MRVVGQKTLEDTEKHEVLGRPERKDNFFFVVKIILFTDDPALHNSSYLFPSIIRHLHCVPWKPIITQSKEGVLEGSKIKGGKTSERQGQFWGDPK